ncbi:zinc finger protein 252-like isoform X2 [Acanthaster planci]|nr:zinc finger protein 252-like isoform X2 [Acanthaster planci]XP_022093493.1 zinc finger protein 252-like isoform X2 [Acanthaster planci]XP_022093494.1 zinc finger protein 252-like isoform X2 [Acanthaster planci]XP_022093497.1 zinc finger protein 252-like isoform X2 [Acanthaster planci]
MKDTHHSNCSAIMSSSSEAMEACVSPTSNPAKIQWSKTPGTQVFPLQPVRDSLVQSEWQPPAKGPGVLRIGDAPSDAHDATEPEGVARPGENAMGGTSDLPEKKPVCDIRVEHSEMPMPPQSKSIPRKFWKHTESENLRVGPKSHLSEETTTPSHQLQRPSSFKCNSGHLLPEEEQSVQSAFREYRKPLLPYTPVSAVNEPSRAEGSAISSGQNQRKPSNLSEIERQRGPLKKRHINYHVLDLSTKRPKVQGVGNPENLLAPSGGDSSSCSQDRPLPTQQASVDQERLCMTLKEEPSPTHLEAAKQEIPMPEAGLCRMPAPDMSDRKLNFVGFTSNLDQKQRLASPSAMHQLAHHAVGSPEVSNANQPGNLVPVLPSTEFVSQWVLHVTQNSDVYAPQHLQARTAPDSESGRSSTSEVSYQGSVPSSPTYRHPGRGPTSSKSAAPKVEKPYACEHCSSTFKHRHHVVRHMRAHNGERPFHCEHCGAAFARKCVLTNHRRTHTGEKPYICSECGDTFSRKHHLVIHQRTHSGEKPYRCRDCGAAFARSHHVNRHRRTHEKEAEMDAQTARLTSSSDKANNQLPTMVSLAQSGTSLDPELELKSSLPRVVTPPADTTTVKTINNPNEQNTKCISENTISTREETTKLTSAT